MTTAAGVDDRLAGHKSVVGPGRKDLKREGSRLAAISTTADRGSHVVAALVELGGAHSSALADAVEVTHEN